MATKLAPILYTFYIIAEGQGQHRPVLMANNGKVPLNEPVNRPSKAERAAHHLIGAAGAGRIAIVRITKADFKKKFPRFAKNAGKRK